MPVHKVRPDISVLADSLEVPGIGHIPVNAFVLHAAQPVVVDTGLGLPDRNFLEALGSVLDPGRRALDLAHPPRPRPHGRDLRPAGRGAQGACGDHLRRRGHHVHRAAAAPGPRATCSTRASPWTSATAPSRASGRRCSTTPPPSASTTTAPASASAPTASAHRMPSAELAEADDVRDVAVGGPAGRPAAVGHGRQPVGADVVDRRSTSARFQPLRDMEPGARPLHAPAAGRPDCRADARHPRARPRTPTRSWGRTRRRWSRCWPGSSPAAADTRRLHRHRARPADARFLEHRTGARPPRSVVRVEAERARLRSTLSGCWTKLQAPPTSPLGRTVSSTSGSGCRVTRSATTMIESNATAPLCRTATSWWASHEMELALPLPGECWDQVPLPVVGPVHKISYRGYAAQHDSRCGVRRR